MRFFLGLDGLTPIEYSDYSDSSLFTYMFKGLQLNEGVACRRWSSLLDKPYVILTPPAYNTELVYRKFGVNNSRNFYLNSAPSMIDFIVKQGHAAIIERLEEVITGYLIHFALLPKEKYDTLFRKYTIDKYLNENP